MAAQSLAYKRILVVEDEFFLAEELCRDLQEVGVTVIGPVPSVRRAIGLIDATSTIDAALLDVNLGGEMAFSVADALLARSVPFVFTSGYDDGILKQRYPQVRCCQKPVKFRTLAEALAAVLAG